MFFAEYLDIRAEEEDVPYYPPDEPEKEIDVDPNEKPEEESQVEPSVEPETVDDVHIDGKIISSVILEMRKPRGFTPPDMPPYNPNPDAPETAQDNLAA